jgi:hypothetical protein
LTTFNAAETDELSSYHPYPKSCRSWGDCD